MLRGLRKQLNGTAGRGMLPVFIVYDLLCGSMAAFE